MNDPIPYKDRKTGLIIFGILEILAGALIGFGIPLLFLSQFVMSQKNAVPMDYKMILFTAIMYGVLALMLICLGIGSIKARRWARDLSLVVSWSVLITGIFTVAFMAWILPNSVEIAMQSQVTPTHLPPGFFWMVMILTLAMETVIMIVIPAVGIFFYGSKHVKATCQARSPVAWTEACPLPVLACCLLLAFGAMIFLLMIFAYTAFPFWGTILTGWPARGCALFLGVVWIYCAWKTYRLAISGWWLQVGVLILMGISNFITFRGHKMLEFYQAAGYSGAQLEQLKRSQEILGPNFTMICAVSSCVVWLAYLLWIKKYFRRSG